MDEWPDYAVPSLEHVHALGVISINYNHYEEALSALFNHHLAVLGIPRHLNEQIYGALPTPRQVEITKALFATFEKDEKVIAAVDHVYKHFAWCFETRNILLHSRHDELAQGLQEGFVGFTKRAKGDYSKLNFSMFSVPELRVIADNMHLGIRFLVDVYFYIAWRDNQLAAVTRRLWGPDAPTLPDKFPIPSPVEVRDHPLIHKIGSLPPRSSPA